MACFSGIWVPLVTPFDASGAIDFPALGRLTQEIAAEAAGLVVCGTTGEPHALSESERLAVLDTVLQQAPACPVVMGIGGIHVPDLLRQIGPLRERRLAGLLVPPPFYMRPTQEALHSFFCTVADHAALPVMLYNIPARTGVAIEIDTFQRLARHPGIVAVKDCGGSSALTMDLISGTPLEVLCGDDAQIFSSLALGAEGIIAASAHLFTDRFVAIEADIRAGRIDLARASFFRLLPLIRLLFAEPNPAPLKAALALSGRMSDVVRAPLCGASASLRAALTTLLPSLSEA